MSKEANPDLQPFAARLRSLRGGLTQDEAASRAGVNPATWQNAELAKNRPWPKTLRAISVAFGGKDHEALYDELHELAHGRPEPFQRLTDEEVDRFARRLAPFLAEALDQLPKRRK